MASLPNGQISVSNILSEFYSGIRETKLSEMEIRCLSTAVNGLNPPVSGFATSGPVSLGATRSRPNPSVISQSFTTPGTYQWVLPVYRDIYIYLVGAGGGEAGVTTTTVDPYGGGCNPRFVLINCGSLPACNAGFCYGNPPFGNICWCYDPSTTTIQGGPGSDGTDSSISFVTANGSPINMAIARGGKAGTLTNIGSDGSQIYYSPYDLITHPNNTLSAPGGTGGSGNNGGSGGKASMYLRHHQTTGYPVWANQYGVTTLYITVGTGGNGGAGGGNNGTNGAVYIAVY